MIDEQVPAPVAEKTVRAWLVQVTPAYSPRDPSAPERMRAEVRLVTARFVVVAWVVVPFTAVKFWRVVDELARRLAKVPRPDEVKLPPVPVVKKRFVVLAVVAKRFVVVAEDEVELTAVKFWRVEDENAVKPPRESILMSSAPVESVKERNLPVKEGVDDALKRVPVVPVALT